MRRLTISVIMIGIVLPSLFYVISNTDVYEDVKSNIVSIPCLSCMKLNPRSVVEFRFETSNGENHPAFVMENLCSGPVFLHYRTDACAACDAMDPVIAEIFEVENIDKPFLMVVKEFNGVNVTLIHMNLDYVEDNFRNSFDVYNILGNDGGVPMFTLVTLGYDRGFVKPCYATLYGIPRNSVEKAKETILTLIDDGINMYLDNIRGYP